MQSPVDPTRLLGKNSQVYTDDGILIGTIIAAGPRGLSVQCPDRVVKIPSGDLRSIRPL